MDEDDRDALIRTVMAEAGPNADPVSMAGVASTVRNRLASGRYGATIKGIVTQPYQFEPWNTAGQKGAKNDPLRFDPNSSEYARAGRVVDAVMAGGPDPTNGATHFINEDAQKALGRSIPQWAQGDPLAEIGGHKYFNPDGAGGAQHMDLSSLLAGVTQGQGGQSGFTGSPLNLASLNPNAQPPQQNPMAYSPLGANFFRSAAMPPSNGYTPNLLGQFLFGQQGARGAMQQMMPQGILAKLFGLGGGAAGGQPGAGAPQMPPAMPPGGAAPNPNALPPGLVSGVQAGSGAPPAAPGPNSAGPLAALPQGGNGLTPFPSLGQGAGVAMPSMAGAGAGAGAAGASPFGGIGALAKLFGL